MLRAPLNAADQAARHADSAGWCLRPPNEPGFGRWQLQTSGSSAGFFMGSPAGEVASTVAAGAADGAGPYFGLFAHSGDLALACREFQSTAGQGGLQAGDRFRWRMVHGCVSHPGSSVGLSLMGRELPPRAEADLLFAHRRFAWEFLQGRENYVLVDREGIRDSGIPFRLTGLAFTLEQTPGDGYHLDVFDLATRQRLAAFQGRLGGPCGTPVRGFAVYNRSAGRNAECDLYFHGFSLAVVPHGQEHAGAPRPLQELGRPRGLFARLKAMVTGQFAPRRSSSDAAGGQP